MTVGPNDFSIMTHSLDVTKKNVNGYSKIFLFNEDVNFNFKNITNIDKDFFPFTPEYVRNKMKNKNRSGWVYQQLIKMYFSYIQSESENILVIDADVFFTKKIKFFDENNKPFFTTSDEYNEAYFTHMKKVHPELTRAHDKSGIAHHMMFNKNLLSSLIAMVEDYHKKPFFDVFIDEINHLESSPCSEYEVYFNYVLKNHEKEYSLRTLKWKNTDKLKFRDFIGYEMISLPHYGETRPSDIISNLKKRDIKKAQKSIYNYCFLKLLSLSIKI